MTIRLALNRQPSVRMVRFIRLIQPRGRPSRKLMSFSMRVGAAVPSGDRPY